MTCRSAGGECLNIIVDFIHFCCFFFFVQDEAEKKMMSDNGPAIKSNFYRRHDWSLSRIEHGNKARLALKQQKRTKSYRHFYDSMPLFFLCVAFRRFWHAALILLLFSISTPLSELINQCCSWVDRKVIIRGRRVRVDNLLSYSKSSAANLAQSIIYEAHQRRNAARDN